MLIAPTRRRTYECWRDSDIADHFENREFILSLAYLADVFKHLNELNISIQGTGMNMITAREKLSSFTQKLPIWIKRIEKGNVANFPSLDEAAGADEELPILTEMKDHLQELIKSFQDIFTMERFLWNRDGYGIHFFSTLIPWMIVI
ncbi:hypothetical protein Pmani_017467 [Petrolisthes manimaculis]|uniref:Uncharacterized protein n=1 Tax=Petrolisthes manimaculis TaxID=1843537 RepID=A0AAE1U5S5_9EUCA|nr:hypothetical protein Pmani_017467 [Petrolisthes manimaculis]